jgi:hypothetical protein
MIFSPRHDYHRDGAGLEIALNEPRNSRLGDWRRIAH